MELKLFNSPNSIRAWGSCVCVLVLFEDPVNGKVQEITLKNGK